MEIQLQELIEKIKKDGVESAAGEAARLKAQAESEAKRIVDTARREAEEIIAKAKSDAERTEKAGIAAVGQASRNLVLAFRGEIETILDAITARETAAAYDEGTLKNVLPELIKSWAAKGSAGSGDALDLLLPEGTLKKLGSFFDEKLAGELKKGLELKPDRNLSAGFRIACKDGSAYYDFSAESVAELLSAYLNPRLSAVVKESAKGI
ncbi:MAG: V-type ATP synthase subunit E [Spirochaetaceae bacterium]|jgi:V/A-type H+-transporting ATPase subunit E|nr:V-type ATP synthase subunit E [Spirochaetaceae bacterium]